jgi:hypothetical protein
MRGDGALPQPGCNNQAAMTGLASAITPQSVTATHPVPVA